MSGGHSQPDGSVVALLVLSVLTLCCVRCALQFDPAPSPSPSPSRPVRPCPVPPRPWPVPARALPSSLTPGSDWPRLAVVSGVKISARSAGQHLPCLLPVSRSGHGGGGRSAVGGERRAVGGGRTAADGAGWRGGVRWAARVERSRNPAATQKHTLAEWT